MQVQSPVSANNQGGGVAAIEQPSLIEKILGLLFIGVVLLGFGLWVSNEAQKLAAAGPPVVPAIIFLEPREGDVVSGPLQVVFETSEPLRWGRDGWQAGDLHIHVGIDDLEVMPSRTDIADLGGNRYEWTIRPLPEGPRTLRLYWAGADHRAITEGQSEAVTVQAR